VTPTYLTGVGVNLNTFVFLLFNLPNGIQILGFLKSSKIVAYQRASVQENKYANIT